MKMNLPNKLTLIRIALIPVFVLLMYFENLWCQLAAAFVFIGASITDYLDGNIARKNNLVTNFGKFADPIADKMLVMSAFIMLVAQGRMPAWVCILMLAREFLISGFRLVAAETGKVIAAGKLGKLKTIFQMISTIALLLFVPVGEGAAILGKFGVITANILMYIALVLTVVSGVDYILRNRECIGDM
jgi:CDP-diacylglycerol--glycerol-3-phosphate 3-phosphatidyltransferase